MSDWEQQSNLKEEAGSSSEEEAAQNKEEMIKIAKQSIIGKKRKQRPEETESDDDFESLSHIPLVKQTIESSKSSASKSEQGAANQASRKRQKTYLEEYLTFGELAGLIPQSLLVNVNFERFASENGFEPLEQTGNLKVEKS